ncbi:PAS domain S-box protein [Halopiger djelfimassiliensis]|uniref:PAS domain S-box protein n=1 Tax=Halopiger djelfimassiliensis TaxID=1293047 RepID=UPI0006776A65|nr:PAS domain S-box protein [Halopiger djelfimassiliensis]
MSRPRVLCVSRDRSTRASVALSLTDTPVNVVIAQRSAEAIDRLEREPIDAVVIDASTIADVPELVDTAESEAPAVPAFVHWGHADGDDDSIAVLSEVVTRPDDTDSAERLATAVTDRIATALADPDRPAGFDRTESPGNDADGPDVTALPTELEETVETVRCRLADVDSARTVERVLRETLTATDRFAFAWVGEYDRGERAIVPWLTDPEASAWPMQRTFDIGSGDQPLLERAMHSEDLQTLQQVADNRDVVPFGQRALERDVQAVAVAPLVSNDDLYGVLVVYAEETVSTAERETIRAIAAVASHVLETIAVRGQLEQQERTLHRYERLVETAGDGMYVLDESGHFMTVNDALVEMTGYSREGLLGEHASILFDETDVEAGEETIRSLLEGEASTATLEMSLETKAGETIPCEAQIALLVRKREFRGSVGVIRDVTERKRSERKLRKQNERLDAFARIVSHDLRNPLGISQGYLDLLEDTESMDHVEHIRDGLDRMESIIDDVLAIARDGTWAAETEPVDLESAVTDAWDHVSTAEATLSVDGTATFEADRSRLLRLLENLFRNAVEHGGADVTVRVGPIGSNGETRGFFVEDTGDGLPDGIRERVFDPSVSTDSDGLGIGLWIVREVATGHGWSVDATESEAGGARFEFTVDR